MVAGNGPSTRRVVFAAFSIKRERKLLNSYQLYSGYRPDRIYNVYTYGATRFEIRASFGWHCKLPAAQLSASHFFSPLSLDLHTSPLAPRPTDIQASWSSIFCHRFGESFGVVNEIFRRVVLSFLELCNRSDKTLLPVELFGFRASYLGRVATVIVP